jgi:hypothetical protein
MSDEYEDNTAFTRDIQGPTLSYTALGDRLMAAQVVYQCDGELCFDTCYWDGNQWVCQALGRLSAPNAQS